MLKDAAAILHKTAVRNNQHALVRNTMSEHAQCISFPTVENVQHCNSIEICVLVLCSERVT